MFVMFLFAVPTGTTKYCIVLYCIACFPGKGEEPPVKAGEVVCELPKPVMAYIEQDNANFEEWIQDIVLTQVSLYA